MAKKISAIQVARRITLGILLVGLTVITVLHQKLQGIPSIDALDPFGGLETLMKFLAGGELIKKIEPGSIVLLGGIVALGVLLSRFFCGWFCAFGALQGIFGWIGKKIFRKRFTVPVKLDRVLRLLKYPILAAIIGLTWWTGTLIIRPYDPLAAYGHLAAGFPAIWAEFAVGFVLLVLVLIGSLFYERVFCKYLCPLGAFNAILSRIPLFRIKRSNSTCISCSKCDAACPMNVKVSTADSVDSPECIACMECVTACPTKKETLKGRIAGKGVNTWAVVALGFAIFAAAALIGQAAGMLRFAAPSLKTMAQQGALNVADIKGSSTYRDVADSFGIELEKLYRELGLDPATVPADTKLKDTGAVAGIAGFEADQVRVAVAKILGIPYAGEKGTEARQEPAMAAASPGAAPSALAAVASARSGAKPGASAKAVASAKPADAVPASQAVPGSVLVVPDSFSLEGTMTIADVAKALDASAAQVIEKLGLPADIPTDKPLRDMKDQYGYALPDLKARIKE